MTDKMLWYKRENVTSATENHFRVVAVRNVHRHTATLFSYNSTTHCFILYIETMQCIDCLVNISFRGKKTKSMPD